MLNRYTVCLAILALSLCTPPLSAHAEFEQRLKQLNWEISQTPTSTLYIRRALLEMEHKNWQTALLDLQQAATLGTSLTDINYHLALLYYRQASHLTENKQKTIHLKRSKTYLDKLLDQDTAHADAYLLRARVLRQLQDLTAAAKDYQKAIKLTEKPRTALYLELSDTYLLIDNSQQAIQTISNAVNRLGKQLSLVQRAIAITKSQSDYQSALKWQQHLPSSVYQLPQTQIEKGDFLFNLGQHQQANKVWCQSQTTLNTMSRKRRTLPMFKKAVVDLSKRIKTPCPSTG